MPHPAVSLASDVTELVLLGILAKRGLGQLLHR
jgi:hypothetical protein